MCSGASKASSPSAATARTTIGASPAGKTPHVPKPAFTLREFVPGIDNLHIPPTEISTFRCQPNCQDPKTRCGDHTRNTKCHHKLLGDWKQATTGKVRKAVLCHNARRREQRDHTFTEAATGAEIAAHEDWAAGQQLICDKCNTARENSLSFLGHRLRVLNESTTDPAVLAFKEGAVARRARAQKLLHHGQQEHLRRVQAEVKSE